VEEFFANGSPADFPPKPDVQSKFSEQPEFLGCDQNGAINRGGKTDIQPACAFMTCTDFGFGEPHV
jgi:hypothetical protein